MDEPGLLGGELEKRASAIAYGISRALHEQFADKAVLDANDDTFDLQEYAGDKHCTATPKPGIHSQIETQWTGPAEGLDWSDWTAWYRVVWEAHELEVVTTCWKEFHCTVHWQWIIADSIEVARRFFESVCEWCHEVRGQVLVFSGGQWRKNAELFQAIANSSFDSLILQGDMKAEIRADFEQFLASRGVYEKYGVPWKRGALFLGPPGNGKTHCLKSLINSLSVPCLYVQSFNEPFGNDQSAGIKSVFARARKSAPCLLVLEDIDSLIAPESRSFFLNELDGFAENSGLITLATTNHPERLDSSILERPSRFDRKYHFGPPGSVERSTYLSMWHEKFASEMRLTPDEILKGVELTNGFSYAYMKELILSSLMRWMSDRGDGKMGRIFLAQATTLRQQMGNATPEGFVERRWRTAWAKVATWRSR